jgi:hypothetical protein
MNANVGAIDRTLRLGGGLVLIWLALLGIGTPWTWIGVVLLVTAVIGWCPAYRLFGIRTCPAHTRKHAA